MREDAFRAFLTPRLSPETVASYLANLRAVERMLCIDVDRVDLSADAIRVLGLKLKHAGMLRARVSDCGSALKQYAAFRSTSGETLFAPRLRAPPGRSRSTDPLPRSAFVRQANVSELMCLYADVIEELRERQILRTGNGPVGDYAEFLFTKAFDWTLASNSSAYHDAIDSDGCRYQIKGRRLGGAGSRQLGALRSLPDKHFDVLAAVLFDRDMQVLRAALIPYRLVVAQARRHEHTNSWSFTLSDATWLDTTVRDATEALRLAARLG